ncbi:MAG TPA: methyltransferase domain-containing protein, partial [Vicinamibacterales bacterium]|nr:methyltransferase domain-containing protein [Vicinamibacterales bacterium]
LPHQVPGLEIAGVTGLGLLVLVTVAACWRRQISALLADVPAGAGRSSSRPQVRLFIASFAALFLEVALIRYTGSQLRVFSFFKNVPLIAAYLGLGVGCALGDGRPRHVVSFLLFFVPVVAFLSAGTFVFSGMLGRAAAAATTEHILGDAVVRSAPELLVLGAQVGIGGFCLVTLLGFSSLFVPLGRLLGGAFEQLPRLSAYTINILGSLAGTLVFVLLSYWWMPPWVWMLVGLSPLLWWLDRRRDALFAVGLIALSALTTAPAIGETIWSPYQKLVGQAVKVQPNPSGEAMPGYLVEISDVFYQVAVDLRPAAVARSGQNPYPHYDNAFRVLSRPIQRVLIVGSGTGNDVAAALRAGAMAVDAVDIDPAIVSLGREHHPERPYADPRVRVIVDDARAAFRKLPAGAYDAVLFGLLDSHTQLGMSSVRLDNYVFTRESFAEARRLLRPGGRMVVTAATFRDWFRQRFIDMLSTTCDSPVQTQDAPGGAWVTYDCQINGTGPTELAGSTAALLPTDDWPFLYLPERAIPRAYSLVVVLLAFGCFLVIRGNGLSPARFRIYHAHLFFLGAAFLLMEVYAINRLALLFGTTWTVSAVAVMVVLTLIVAANLTLTGIGSPPYAVAYAGLFGSLIVSYSLGPDAVLGQGVGLAIAYSFAVLLPVYFAGLVFARSFAIAPIAGTAIGANMLGAVVGGWAEYIGMALGIRALLVLAMSFYLGSLVCWRSSKSGPHPT